MLVLTRKLGETLLIGDNIKITVEKISKGQIKIGIDAPREVVIAREEVSKKENVQNVMPSASEIINHIKE